MEVEPNVLVQVSPILANALAALLLGLVGVGIAWLKKKIKLEGAQEYFVELDKLQGSVETAVKEQQQIYSSAAADGVITPAEKQQMKIAAKAFVDKQLTPQGKKILEKGMADVTIYVNAMIEKEVLDMKLSRPPLSP